MDAEALDATLATGEVHFHSRSRDRLWRKGETSGNVLRLGRPRARLRRRRAALTVDPVGPTCHRGTRCCFDPDGAPRAERDDRRASPGSRRCGRRSPRGPPSARPARTRRACSTAASTRSAARSPRRRPRCCSPPRTTPPPRSPARTGRRHAAALAGETADLLYHALVLLAERGRRRRPTVIAVAARAPRTPDG